MAMKKIEGVEGAEQEGVEVATVPVVAAIPEGVGTSGANTGATVNVAEVVTPSGNTVSCPRCEVSWNTENRSGTIIPCTCGFMISVA